MFYKNSINKGLLWILTLVTSFMGAVLGFKLGTRLFANPRVPKALRHVKLLLKELKEIVSFERK